MTREAIITAVIVQTLIIGFTCYFFYKVLTTKPESELHERDEEANNT